MFAPLCLCSVKTKTVFFSIFQGNLVLINYKEEHVACLTLNYIFKVSDNLSDNSFLVNLNRLGEFINAAGWIVYRELVQEKSSFDSQTKSKYKQQK